MYYHCDMIQQAEEPTMNDNINEEESAALREIEEVNLELEKLELGISNMTYDELNKRKNAAMIQLLDSKGFHSWSNLMREKQKK